MSTITLPGKSYILWLKKKTLMKNTYCINLFNRKKKLYKILISNKISKKKKKFFLFNNLKSNKMNLNTLPNQFNNIIKYKNINYFSTNNRILRFDKEIWAIQHFFRPIRD